MKAKATAFLLADLGVTRSHNRPHTSNDNPFSESHLCGRPRKRQVLRAFAEAPPFVPTWGHRTEPTVDGM
jgi:hypothetical protein